MNLEELYQSYKSNALAKHDYIKVMHQKHQILFDYADYIKSTDIESIQIDNEDIIFKIKGSEIKLLVDREDSRFIPIEILNFKSFDPIERDLIFALAKQSQQILDIGANIGWYSLNFDTFDNVKNIHAFEPIPHTYSYFKKHLALNKSTKVIDNNFALSDEAGEIEFYWHENETGSSSMHNIQDRKNAKIVYCQTQTLDKYAQDNNIQVDMIKCDVEGAELLVFQGGLSTISRDTPFIFTEMLRKWSAKFDYHPNDIIELLKSVGYQCFAFDDGVIKEFLEVNDNTTATNFFFLHQQKHQHVINTF